MGVIGRLFRRYRQFGGFKLVWAYVRLGVFPEFIRQGCAVLRGRHQISEAYSQIQSKVVPHIRRRYVGLLNELIAQYSRKDLIHEHSHKVWVCWLQGMENAPEIVKVCQASLGRCLKDRKIVVITQENINEYVTFPEHIQKKFERGIIPMAQYCDLLRLELLTRYGGTWIDATVLCTVNVNFNHNDNNNFNLNHNVNYFDAELFLFQHLKKGDDGFYGISNWFITASSNQKVLLILRDMLYQYWRDYDCVVAYFIFHIFFNMIAEQMPEEIRKMPRLSSKYCFYLEHRLGDEYDEEWMRELTKRCFFHKLNGRLWDEADGKTNTFRDYLKKEYYGRE